MGLFQHKNDPKKVDETSDGVQKFFNKYFKELEERGAKQFEKNIDEATAKFTRDLDSVITKADQELKEHIVKRIDELMLANASAMKDAQNAALESINRRIQSIQKENEQFADTVHEQLFASSKAIKDTQEAAVSSMNRSVQNLEQQQHELGKTLEKTTADQSVAITKVINESQSRVAAMGDAQTKALEWLNQSIVALSEQQQQLTGLMQKSIETQQAMVVQLFEDNMAQVVEHYLLTALGDQYDLKAQLPSIIKQMEANKQAIAEDMKL